MSISIYIDADNCPNLVLKYTCEYCKNNDFNLIVVANKEIKIPESNYQMIICEKEKDAADKYILTKASENDLVITKDIIFAEKLVSKNIVTINDRGSLFDKSNIKARMEDRNLDIQLAALGFGGKKGSSYNEKQLTKFAGCLEKAISILRRRDNP